MTQTRLYLALSFAAASTVWPTVAAAQIASATAQVEVQILRNIQLTKTSDLEFGGVISGTAPSTVTVSQSNTVTCGAGLTCVGTTSPASFDVRGTAAFVVLVGGDSLVTLTGDQGGTMTASLDYSTAQITLSTNAIGGSFRVGGTLNVGANQTPGAYVGTFTVTAIYL